MLPFAFFLFQTLASTVGSERSFLPTCSRHANVWLLLSVWCSETQRQNQETAWIRADAGRHGFGGHKLRFGGKVRSHFCIVTTVLWAACNSKLNRFCRDVADVLAKSWLLSLCVTLTN